MHLHSHPLSIYEKAEQTLIDGKQYFDLETDLKMRESQKKEKAALIQKAIADKSSASKKPSKKVSKEWHCEEIIDFWAVYNSQKGSN